MTTFTASEKAMLDDIGKLENKVTELEACNDELTTGLFSVLNNLGLIEEANVYRDASITYLIKETRQWINETLKDAGR